MFAQRSMHCLLLEVLEQIGYISFKFNIASFLLQKKNIRLAELLESFSCAAVGLMLCAFGAVG
jgi:hypothetical protein